MKENSMLSEFVWSADFVKYRLEQLVRTQLRNSVSLKQPLNTTIREGMKILLGPQKRARVGLLGKIRMRSQMEAHRDEQV